MASIAGVVRASIPPRGRRSNTGWARGGRSAAEPSPDPLQGKVGRTDR